MMLYILYSRSRYRIASRTAPHRPSHPTRIPRTTPTPVQMAADHRIYERAA